MPTHFIAVRTDAPHIVNTARHVIESIVDRDASLAPCAIKVPIDRGENVDDSK